jgi:hypothetical protein
MLDWWSELPPWLRLTTAFGLMVGGTLVAYYANIRLGLLMLGVGSSCFYWADLPRQRRTDIDSKAGLT